MQGSALGPAAFIITASDLHPVHSDNKEAKYADDMYLIVGSAQYHTIPEELAHVAAWAAENNLRLNPNKTKEMIVVKRGSKTAFPPPTPGIERVTGLKVLGVTLQYDLKMEAHIMEVLASCSSSLYALCVLRNHGLPPSSLH